MGSDSDSRARELRDEAKNMMLRASMWVVIWLLSAALSAAPTVPSSGQDVVAGLERGSITSRHNALVRILETPSDQWPPEVWSAIRREVARMLAYYRQPRRDKDDVGEVYGEYYLELVVALSESRDPVDIPLLVDICGSGKAATDALVRFGDLAVPALLQAVRGQVDDRHQVTGATFALADMLQVRMPDAVAPVSESSRAQISAVAQELLEKRLSFGNVIPVTNLALATGRRDLRQELERLANDPAAWTGRGLVDRVEIERSQRIIRRRLARTPQH